MTRSHRVLAEGDGKERGSCPGLPADAVLSLFRPQVVSLTERVIVWGPRERNCDNAVTDLCGAFFLITFPSNASF